MHHSVATVPIAATAAMLYARIAAASTCPGLRRLLALTPVLALLTVLPVFVTLYTIRGLTAFFLVWLCEFKLLLLAFGAGPLDPAIRPLPFVFTAALPVKLRQRQSSTKATTTVAETVALPLLSSSVKFAVMAAMFGLLHSKKITHPYAVSILYGIIIYCALDSVFPCLAAVGRALGMEMEPQFNKPYLSASLQDFWGRRWNLMASAVLRPSVYDPVRARLGAAAGVLATFLVSGFMHEVVVYYITFKAPTGHVTAFFVLHGACVCAERWCGATAKPPRVVATPLVVAFVAGTAFWLFFPPLFGDGMSDLYVAETVTLGSSFLDAGIRLLRLTSP
ncbi:hypothetical protein U9M48_026779 [Paspalum notatum var. saurae]|uniref:Wax synthase domain-containing protein n=1 Tax=Paspalum notatum var. saurae TaxID=547442 RepID=A0AAQ3WYP0_PASNO